MTALTLARLSPLRGLSASSALSASNRFGGAFGNGIAMVMSAKFWRQREGDRSAAIIGQAMDFARSSAM